MNHLQQLNTLLKEHPLFEDWMCFDSVEKVKGVYYPTYKSTKGVNTELNELQLKNITDSVCEAVFR